MVDNERRWFGAINHKDTEGLEARIAYLEAELASLNEILVDYHGGVEYMRLP